jgi:hypothetical protein
MKYIPCCACRDYEACTKYKIFTPTTALFTIIDRRTQDDRRSKINISALFSTPVQAEDYIEKAAPNPETKWYILPLDELETFENFYNDMQHIKAKYGAERGIWHIDETEHYYTCDETNKYRHILGIYNSLETIQ